MTTRQADPFTVETYNAGDKGTPELADFIHVTERPPRAVLQAFADRHGLDLWYPEQGSEAMLWNPKRMDVHGTRIELATKSGRSYGEPGTSPKRHTVSWWGLLDGVKRVAFVGGHLINNRWGKNVRGERALRIKLWAQGWASIRREAKRLRKMGYATFRLGDFNRKLRDWVKMRGKSIGAGYDRIIHPSSAELVSSRRGDRAGSDHAPLIGTYRLK